MNIIYVIRAVGYSGLVIALAALPGCAIIINQAPHRPSAPASGAYASDAHASVAHRAGVQPAALRGAPSVSPSSAAQPPLRDHGPFRPLATTTIIAAEGGGRNLVIDLVPPSMTPVIALPPMAMSPMALPPMALPPTRMPPMPRPGGQMVQIAIGGAAIGKMPPPVPRKPVPVSTGVAVGAHGCALFGARVPGACQSYPQWVTGTWTAPPGVTRLHVLLVGGGGAGSASVGEGIGGQGGASGAIRVRMVQVAPGAKSLPIKIAVGQGGSAGGTFGMAGANGGASLFGALIARGGGGGGADRGGSIVGGARGAPAPMLGLGSGGGGGGGGGTYQFGYHGGAGGAGGSNGARGMAGQAGTDPTDPVQGLPGGAGRVFPNFDFQQMIMEPGASGRGGFYGDDQIGYGGGGGGGGGGVLIEDRGPHAAERADAGANGLAPHGAQGGLGGAGFGAGGGGGGNFTVGAPGGAGARAVVYVEW